MATKKTAAEQLFKPLITEEREEELLKLQGGSGLGGLINRLVPGQTAAQKGLQQQIDDRQEASRLVQGVDPSDPAALRIRAQEILQSGSPQAQNVANNLSIRAAELEKSKTEQEKLVATTTQEQVKAAGAQRLSDVNFEKAESDRNQAGLEVLQTRADQEATRILGALGSDVVKLRRRSVTESDAGRGLISGILREKADEVEQAQLDKSEFERLATRARGGEGVEPLSELEELRMENLGRRTTQTNTTDISPNQLGRLQSRISGSQAGIDLMESVIKHITDSPEDFGAVGGVRRAFQTTSQVMREVGEFAGFEGLVGGFSDVANRLGIEQFDEDLASVGNFENAAVFLLARALQGGDGNERLLKASIERAAKELNFQGATSAKDAAAKLSSVLPRIKRQHADDVRLLNFMGRSSPLVRESFNVQGSDPDDIDDLLRRGSEVFD